MAQKKRKKKLNVRKLFVFILFFYLVGYGVYYVLSEPVRNILISGTTYINDADVIEVAGLKNYPAYSSLRNSKLKKKIKSLPLVEDVSIKRNLLFQLKIKIKEKKAICVYDDNNKILLSDGSQIDNVSNIVGIPSLVNYTKEDVLKKFLSGMGNLDYGIISSISEIEYSPDKSSTGSILDETRFMFRMNDGNIVYINLDKLDNMKYYFKIYASLNNKKGILHLDSGDYMEVK